MHMLKNILTSVALLPLLPAIVSAWACVWLTPKTSDKTGEYGNGVIDRRANLSHYENAPGGRLNWIHA